MRNAVIRKKRLEEQRIIERFMRYPQRIVLGADMPADIDWVGISQQRIWANDGPSIGLWPMGANAPI